MSSIWLPVVWIRVILPLADVTRDTVYRLWCDKLIPLPYSYIQDSYWNVEIVRTLGLLYRKSKPDNMQCMCQESFWKQTNL